MRKNKSHLIVSLMIGTSLLALSSCGGGGSGGGGGGGPTKQRDQARREEERRREQRAEDSIEVDMNGQYMARLKTLNEAAAGVITGSVTMSREADQVISYVRFSGRQGKVLHPQYIHVGTKCPDATDDLNGDGFLDAVEVDQVVGKVLIPLDADLSSQDRGSSIWTVADDYGFYHYTDTTSYDRMIGDLREGDLDPEDDFMKLEGEKAFALSGKVFLVYGVDKETPLPPTVARRGRLANFQNLPVACGVFEKVHDVPGTADNDRELGTAPVGETIGGSSGADDGTTIIVGEGNGQAGSTTGEPEGWTTGGSVGEPEGWTTGGAPSEPLPVPPTVSTTGGEATAEAEVQPQPEPEVSSTTGGVIGL